MQIQTPDWVKHAVFYQIFPDRFAKSKQPRKRLLQNFMWEEWHEIPTLQGYKGGDLWGVMEQLDYLQDIGINAIYFTPIFQSASNHRYHTHDYYQVDPMLGGNLAFKDLLTPPTTATSKSSSTAYSTTPAAAFSSFTTSSKTARILLGWIGLK